MHVFFPIRATTFASVLASAFVFLFLPLTLRADLPPDLPGEEISDDYMNLVIPGDSIEKKTPATSPESQNWLERVMQTWDAPPLSQQLAEDKTNIPIGKGAVFIPRFSNASFEPDVEIIDSTGKALIKGEPGRKFNLMPGNYSILLGSGSQKQRIVRKVEIAENKVTPLIPDWCGLSVDIVDNNNIPFRGEYEMVRIDEFEPHGKGYGRDPNLGEKVKTWILKPGIYKIFGVGESYNTLNNFVTVRLVAGEYVRFLLVQSADQFKIESGGIVEVSTARKTISNWSYGVNIGGSILFNAKDDRRDEENGRTNTTQLALLCNSSLKYEKRPFEWNSKFVLDEGFSFPSFDVPRLESSIDELRFPSLFLWRFLSWLGPYARFEIQTSLFPDYERVEGEPHLFVVMSSDSAIFDIDTVKTSMRLRPSFSPLSMETGVGANADIISTRHLETEFRVGFGFSQVNIWNHSAKLDAVDSSIIAKVRSSYSAIDSAYVNTVFIQRIENITTREYGPEAALNVSIKVGKWATAETELKIFAPVERTAKPDYSLTSTLSWRLARAVTLDYQYSYNLSQPQEIEARKDESFHRVLVRFSYTTR